jgi:hypothetical protein
MIYEYESDSIIGPDGRCSTLEVEFTIHPTSEDDAYAEVESVYVKGTNTKVNPATQLDSKEWENVLNVIDAIAYENAYEAWYDKQIGMADFMDYGD